METEHPVKREAYELTAGERLRIEVGSHTPLNEEVPEGKIWVISVEVHIEERDARSDNGQSKDKAR